MENVVCSNKLRIVISRCASSLRSTSSPENIDVASYISHSIVFSSNRLVGNNRSLCCHSCDRAARLTYYMLLLLLINLKCMKAEKSLYG